jgi:hypothetical protein
MLRTSLTKKRGKVSAKEVPRTPTRAEKKSNSRGTALLNGSSDKKKAKQPPTPESSESSSDSDNDGEFEVEAILGRKVNREGKVFYRIKWKGFDLRYATWEPEDNVSNAPKLIETYEKTLKSDGNDDKGDRKGRQPKDLLRKRGLDELAGRKKGGPQKSTNRKKMMESEDDEEEEEDFYDEDTDEEEAEDEEEEQEEQVEEDDREEESESDEEQSEGEEEGKGGRKGKKAPVANPVNARKGAKKLKTETVSAMPVKEISKEKKKAEPVPVVSNEAKRKSVGKVRIQEEVEEAPVVVQLQQKEMQIELPVEEKKDIIQEEKIAPVEITRVSMLEENEEKSNIPSKKNSLVIEPAPIQQEDPKPTTPADPEVIKKMIIEEESPEKAAAAAALAKIDTTVHKPAVSAPTKPSRDDADHATNVLRELGRTSSAFKINLEAKSDYNNLLLSRNNSGFQQAGSAFNSSKTSAIPSQKDSKHSANEVAPVNPNPNSANPLLGLLNHKDSPAVPSALSLPFGHGNPLLNNPLLYGGAAAGLDEETARKNQIVFQGYLQISNYMLPQNNPMAAMNNNRMRNMLGANPFAAMNPLHNPFMPNSANFPGYFGMPNPLLAGNPLFPGMGMTPGLPNFFNPMGGMPGNAGNNMRNNMMFNEMMKSGLSPSNMGLLQGMSGGTGASTPSGNNGKSEKSKEIIILDDKKDGEKGKKKEVSEKK